VDDLDLSRLAPADAAAALRSYPRRFRGLLAPLDPDEDPEELAQRLGPSGCSVLGIVTDTTRTWVLLHDAMRRITITDSPVLHPAVTDSTRRDWEAPAPATLSDALGMLEDTAAAFADDVDRTPATAWTRTGTIAGDGTTTALDVLREAVRVGHDALGAAGRTLAAVRA